MGRRCDITDQISELLGGGPCPVCATTGPTELTLDAWDEQRAGGRALEPEPLILRIRG